MTTEINTDQAPGASSQVDCEVNDRGIAFVTLKRPEKHNAFDDAMIRALRQHFESLASRSDVRVLVLQAEGRSFSAGGDLAWMQRMASYDYADNLSDARELALMLYALRNLPQPSIARIQGNAFGGAVGLISCCDIAIAARTACFGLTETRLGLIPATIGPYVIEAIGPRWARRLFQTGERFDAELAQEIQLIHERCDDDALDDALEHQINALLRNGPIAMREAKQLVTDLFGRPIDEAMLEDTGTRIARLRVSQEGQAGLQAFLQKREAPWIPGRKD